MKYFILSRKQKGKIMDEFTRVCIHKTSCDFLTRDILDTRGCWERADVEFDSIAEAKNYANNELDATIIDFCEQCKAGKDELLDGLVAMNMPKDDFIRLLEIAKDKDPEMFDLLIKISESMFVYQDEEEDG
jgi:hypothetical protein